MGQERRCTVHRKERIVREINKIIIHCSASDNPDHDDVAVIDRWHRARGWSQIGYHYFVTKDGEVQIGRPVSKKGAHCKGENYDSIGICFHGLESFTHEQFEAGASLVEDLMGEYNVKPVNVFPHNKFNKYKSCPVFNVAEILKRIGHKPNVILSLSGAIRTIQVQEDEIKGLRAKLEMINKMSK